MKTKFLPVLALAAIFPLSGAWAQTPSTPPASAPAMAAAAPNQVIYSPRLPSATELSNAAAAQGVSIDKIEQNATQVTVVYRNSSGQVNTVAYQLLPTANGGANAAVAAPASPAPVVVAPVAPAPQVVYYQPDYAYGYGPAYYSPYWYPPVSFRLGLNYGFRGGYGRVGFGGFHHWR